MWTRLLDGIKDIDGLYPLIAFLAVVVSWTLFIRYRETVRGASAALATVINGLKQAKDSHGKVPLDHVESALRGYAKIFHAPDSKGAERRLVIKAGLAAFIVSVAATVFLVLAAWFSHDPIRGPAEQQVLAQDLALRKFVGKWNQDLHRNSTADNITELISEGRKLELQAVDDSQISLYYRALKYTNEGFLHYANASLHERLIDLAKERRADDDTLERAMLRSAKEASNSLRSAKQAVDYLLSPAYLTDESHSLLSHRDEGRYRRRCHQLDASGADALHNKSHQWIVLNLALLARRASKGDREAALQEGKEVLRGMSPAFVASEIQTEPLAKPLVD
jgi:hypothetical protein